MGKTAPALVSVFQRPGRLEAICTFANDVKAAQETPWLIGDASRPSRGLRREFADRALDLLEDARFDYSAPADSLLWKFLTGLLPYDAPILDKRYDLTGLSGTPLLWEQGLHSIRRHPTEARHLCYLLSIDQYGNHHSPTDLSVFNDLAGEYLDSFATTASLFNVGMLLASLEKRDPSLSSVRSGIQAFVDRSLTGEAVTGTKIASTLRGVLQCIWADLETAV